MTAKISRLAEFLPYLLSVTSNAVSGRIAEEYRSRFGLKIPEWRVIAVLGDAGAITQRDLVRATLMEKVAVSRACMALEQRALLERRPNLADGRSHHLVLTAAGTMMHREIMPMALEMERRIFSVLSKGEHTKFKDILERLRSQVSALEAPAPAENS